MNALAFTMPVRHIPESKPLTLSNPFAAMVASERILFHGYTSVFLECHSPTDGIRLTHAGPHRASQTQSHQTSTYPRLPPQTADCHRIPCAVSSTPRIPSPLSCKGGREGTGRRLSMWRSWGVFTLWRLHRFKNPLPDTRGRRHRRGIVHIRHEIARESRNEGHCPACLNRMRQAQVAILRGGIAAVGRSAGVHSPPPKRVFALTRAFAASCCAARTTCKASQSVLLAADPT